jgi:hypothetical protein
MKHPKMLTLTMPLWTGDPRLGIQELRRCWNKLRKHKLFRDVRGGAYQIEVKPKEVGWHIHIHVLMDSPYMPYQQLFSAWRNILECDAPQVHIVAADNVKQLEYVCKYTSKSADFSSASDTIVRWYYATRGLRLFATFGTWYNATLNDLDPNADERDPVSICPHCGAEATTFCARDGPFIFGGKEWNNISRFFHDMHDVEVEMEEVVEAVDIAYHKSLARGKRAVQQELKTT